MEEKKKRERGENEAGIRTRFTGQKRDTRRRDATKTRGRRNASPRKAHFGREGVSRETKKGARAVRDAMCEITITHP